MKMSSYELNAFRSAADKAYQAEIICVLVESYPSKLEPSDINVICRLLKKLAGDVYVYMGEEIYKQEQLQENQQKS
ncbi:TPA: hypothetical protein ACGT6A_002282 [Salmonella enterica]|nr:hypothetical protein [Salmonella enterica subsp. enterica serovar Reading]EFT4509978.1 hypothetical protein [Salmonella enterica subsp. enterica serovar Stanley]